MRASDPDVTARLNALFGPAKDVTVRPIGHVLGVLKYLSDMDALSMRTSRELSRAK